MHSSWGDGTYSKLSKPVVWRLCMAGISDEAYEQLRRILERQNERTYLLEEVKEVGDGLIDFFTLLLEFSDGEEGHEEGQ